MKIIYIYIASLVLGIGVLNSCKKSEHKHSSTKEVHHQETDSHTEHKEEHSDRVMLTKEQAHVLGISKGKITQRNMSGYIQANGTIEVPPQNEAIITTSLGANIVSIKVIEGEEVKKGQVLATISHSDIISIQTDYLQTYNELNYLEQDFQRHQKLYDANVGSGRDFQKAKSAYLSAKGLVKGYESQLGLLGLHPKKIREGEISSTAPVKSTIDGFIELVGVKTGQYVQPQTALFEIVNTEHIHADLMVFEKDIKNVRNGQKVKLSIKSLGEEEMTGKIFSVGKSIEEGPKALHVHVEIDGHYENLIIGMYINARIIIDEKQEQAFPEEAFIKQGERLYVFKVEEKEKLEFEPVEVIEKNSALGYVSFVFKTKQDADAEFANSGAYYLMAELKKSEAEHSH
jgi:cobalt-zinc-cadmium efflux system membrane fusion protein